MKEELCQTPISKLYSGKKTNLKRTMVQGPLKSSEDVKRIKLDVDKIVTSSCLDETEGEKHWEKYTTANQSIISDTFHGQLKNTVSFICSLKMHTMSSLHKC